MIQTSFFAGKSPKGRRVCIAKWARFWHGPRASLFAPSNPRAEDWQAAYRRDLESRFPDAAALRMYLDAVESETPDPILCCYEADPAECHRSILAEFIFEKLGIRVTEWQPQSSPAARPAAKPSRPRTNPKSMQLFLI